MPFSQANRGPCSPHRLAGILALALAWRGDARPDCRQLDDPAQLLDFHLEMDPADWDAVRRDTSFAIERPASFRCGDEPAQRVAVGRKPAIGLPSGEDPRKVSLKVDFDDAVEDGEWHGHRKLNLENGLSDQALPCSILREGIAWQLMARAGVIGGGSSWVRVHLNGELLGIYIRVEHVDKSFLRRHIAEDEGFLYKFDRAYPDGKRRLTREDEPDPYEAALCFPPFDGACGAPPHGLSVLREHLDIHQLITLGAVDTILSNFDGLLESHNNYFWYNSERPRLYFPWDLDLSMFDAIRSRPPHVSEVERLLFEVAPELRAYFDRVLRRLCLEMLAPDNIDRLLEEVSREVGPAIEADPLNGLGRTFAAERAYVRVWLNGRRDFLLEKLPASAPSPVVINEILAANDRSGRDEAGEADDWVELYNRGAAPVELGGLHLSDDPAAPRKWSLPAATLMPGARVLVWCDREAGQGPFHASFQLDQDGEGVGLYAVEDGIARALDFVRFGPQAADRSLGRVPDGAATLREGLCPTPDAANEDRSDCPAPGPERIRGDVDASGRLAVTDAVRLLLALFAGATLDCAGAGDVDDDGRLAVTDAVRLLGYLFRGGEAPPAPFPHCGSDPSPDDLACGRSSCAG
jgi:hypothetical protein